MFNSVPSILTEKVMILKATWLAAVTAFPGCQKKKNVMFYKRWKLQTALPIMVGFQSLLPGSKKNFHQPWSNTTKLKNENSWQTMCIMLPDLEWSFFIESRYKNPFLIFSSYHASNVQSLPSEAARLQVSLSPSTSTPWTNQYPPENCNLPKARSRKEPKWHFAFWYV